MTEHRDSTGRILSVGDWLFYNSALGQIDRFHDTLLQAFVTTHTMNNRRLIGSSVMFSLLSSIKIPFDKTDFLVYRASEFEQIND